MNQKLKFSFLDRLDFQMTLIGQGWFYKVMEIDDNGTSYRLDTFTLHTRGFICSINEQVSGKWDMVIVPGAERYSKKNNLIVASCLFIDPYEAVFSAYNAIAASDQLFPWKPYPDNAYF